MRFHVRPSRDVDAVSWAGPRTIGVSNDSHPPTDRRWVSWASDQPVPYWFNLAQEFTERWVHQQQMREAVGRVEDH